MHGINLLQQYTHFGGGCPWLPFVLAPHRLGLPHKLRLLLLLLLLLRDCNVDVAQPYSKRILAAQSGDSFEFALRLCGHAKIWRECSKFVVDKEAGILQFPAEVLLPAGRCLQYCSLVHH